MGGHTRILELFKKHQSTDSWHIYLNIDIEYQNILILFKLPLNKWASFYIQFMQWKYLILEDDIKIWLCFSEIFSQLVFLNGGVLAGTSMDLFCCLFHQINYNKLGLIGIKIEEIECLKLINFEGFVSKESLTIKSWKINRTDFKLNI